MMIPILIDYYKRGYLPFPKYKTLITFFPNCNLAVRKEALKDADFYDETFKMAAEDPDLCHRVFLRGWKLFYEPKAICYHESRRSFFLLIKQWVIYGYYSAFLFNKYRKDIMVEIFISLDLRPKFDKYFRLFKLVKFPIPILIFLSSFSVINMLILFILISIYCKFIILGFLLGFALTCFLINLFISSSLKKLSLKDIIIYIFITYVINTSCILGSIAGGIRKRMVYIYPGL